VNEEAPGGTDANRFPAGPRERGGCRSPRDLPVPVILGLYALISVLFTWIYFRTTVVWTETDLAAYTSRSNFGRALVPIMRDRLFMPYLAWAIEVITHARFSLIYRGLAALSVFASLLGYRRYLANFMCLPCAGMLAAGLVYPLLWNLCLLNKLYFPFDLPSLLFFIVGLDAIQRRNWWVFYIVLALGFLNRETAAFLSLGFVFCLYNRMPLRHLLAHLAAQAVLLAGLRLAVSTALGVHPDWFESTHMARNIEMLRDMVTLRGNALKDWAKLILLFGGLWLALPKIWRIQPAFIKRAILVLVPFLATMFLGAILDEVRDYMEIIPLVLTPVVYWICSRLRWSSADGLRCHHT
jgi:hypothetical protein